VCAAVFFCVVFTVVFVVLAAACFAFVLVATCPLLLLFLHTAVRFKT
jgi:hypothetical protein